MKHSRLRRGCAAACLLCLLVLAGAAPVAADYVDVTSTAWGEVADVCTLFEAIQFVQDLSGPSRGCQLVPDNDALRVRLQGSQRSPDDCPNGETICFFTYSAEDEYPEITSTVKIRGAHATIERAPGSDHRFFKVASGGVLDLLKVSLVGGSKRKGGAIKVEAGGQLFFDRGSLLDNAAEEGGAIFNDGGQVTIDRRVRLAGNFALLDGGAIFSRGGSLTVKRSTFDDNEASLLSTVDDLPISRGGAIYSEDTDVEIKDSTVSGNRAASGGAWHASGASQTMKAVRSTFKDNVSVTAGSVVTVDNGEVEFKKSALDCPEDPCEERICAQSLGACPVDLCSGGILAGGHNVAEDSSCGLERVLDDLPLTDALDFFGGPVPVHAITCGPAAEGEPECPLVDQYDCSGPADQRLIPRPQEVSCDVGAYEAVCNWSITNCPPQTECVGIQVGLGKRPGVAYSIFNSAACASFKLEETTETIVWVLRLPDPGNAGGTVGISRLIFLSEGCQFDCVQEPSRCREFCAVDVPDGFALPTPCTSAPADCPTYAVGVDPSKLALDSYPYMLEFLTDIPGDSTGDWDPEIERPDPPDL